MKELMIVALDSGGSNGQQERSLIQIILELYFFKLHKPKPAFNAQIKFIFIC